ncbi:MAG: DNA alkylation repair protein [Cyclobacteriaceae bacterium]
MNSQVENILQLLHQKGSDKNREGMARFGNDATKAFGVRIPDIKNIGKPYRKKHHLAK